MKRILVFYCLYFVMTLTYASTCPQPPSGYIFRVAAWGDHVSANSQVRCYYYSRNDLGIEYKFQTDEWYNENDIAGSWHGNREYRYALCVTRNNDVNDCPFSYHR